MVDGIHVTFLTSKLPSRLYLLWRQMAAKNQRSKSRG